MKRTILAACAAAALAMTGYGGEGASDYTTRVVTFPNGKEVRAEVMMNRADLTRGMMFRDSLAQDRGMLFVFPSIGQYKCFMYQVRIPLDVVWMNRAKEIVEMAPNLPPCKSERAEECPQFGGEANSLYMLELNAGAIARERLREGDTLKF